MDADVTVRNGRGSHNRDGKDERRMKANSNGEARCGNLELAVAAEGRNALYGTWGSTSETLYRHGRKFFLFKKTVSAVFEGEEPANPDFGYGGGEVSEAEAWAWLERNNLPKVSVVKKIAELDGKNGVGRHAKGRGRK